MPYSGTEKYGASEVFLTGEARDV
ncbi:hypothetical protein MES5069_550178 [Mesorhizobium escarrei]|uniref:Uncharacterized protein n=1 Tax=Mesorhizobium escarrei TaxID=666018 RepID=A0ABM9ED03_9HYPH|nr:hypothetical protein MES5069_550178 [Mesorhizobium escarrei]